MTGASSIGSDSASILDAARPRRTRPHEGEGQPASGFEALLSELHPAPAKDGERAQGIAATRSDLLGSAATPASGLAGGWLAREADMAEPREPVDHVTQLAASPETAVAGADSTVAALDVTRAKAGLAEGVAGRIAAALDGHPLDRATSPDAARQTQTTAAPGRSEGVERAKARLVGSWPVADARVEPGRQASVGVSVVRRETHFVPLSPGIGSRIGGDPAEAGTGTRRGDTPEVAHASRRNSGVEPLIAAFRNRPSPEPATARVGKPQDSVLAQKSHGISPETAIALPTGALPGSAIGAPTGAGAPGIGHTMPASEAPPAAGQVAPAHLATGAGPARVLHIRLHPAELGTLDVRMRMTDAGLELHVEASRHETFALLQRDRDALAGILRGAGHALEAVSISVAEKPGGQSQPTTPDSWQQPASDGRSDAQSGASRDRDGRPDDPSPSRADEARASEQVQDDQDRPAMAARRHDTLYL